MLPISHKQSCRGIRVKVFQDGGFLVKHIQDGFRGVWLQEQIGEDLQESITRAAFLLSNWKLW